MEYRGVGCAVLHPSYSKNVKKNKDNNWFIEWISLTLSAESNNKKQRNGREFSI